MAARSLIRRFSRGVTPILLVGALVLASLALMSNATHGSARFGEVYSLVLLINVVALLTMGVLIGWNLIRLRRQARLRRPGARLAVRMVMVFVLLAVTPVSIVYYFSLQFLHRGIDSWFDVRVEQALDDSLDLSRAALGVRMRELLKQSEVIAADLSLAPADRVASTLEDARRRSGATEMTLFGARGEVVATTNVDPTAIVPDRPSDSILVQLRQSGNYIGLDPIGDSGLHVRVVTRVAAEVASSESRALQALFPVTERMNALADSVQAAYAQYREVAYLRRPLKLSFTLTLSLVLLLSVFTAVLAAFYSARRMVAPLRQLAGGTRAVAEGDFDTELPGSGPDEVGFLVESFNDMTRRLARARDETRDTQRQLETHRAYLEAVLARLSTGVLTLDANARLFTANAAAARILDFDPEAARGLELPTLCDRHPHLVPIGEAVTRRLEPGPDRGDDSADWREEVRLMGPRGRQILMCSGTTLPAGGEHGGGQVVVIDEVTALVDAQRNAAWSEVARRLAHEIRNPLTPIRLAGERLRHKYLDRLGGAEESFDRLTRTIVQQVDAMLVMVNAFSDFARSPRMHVEPADLNALVGDVMELYRTANPGAEFSAELDPALPAIEADVGRLRQVLHNLVKNALEADPAMQLHFVTATRRRSRGGALEVSLEIRDHGPGFDPGMVENLFEPYVTTKPRGTGLGLAIVRRIVDEHGGSVRARNHPRGGASVMITLPATGAAPAAGNA